jgi:Arc/MetJ-type ribon-helix-helix transcriptional regulator
MMVVSVSMSDEMKAFIEARVASEGHASASESIQALVREDQRQAKLSEGLRCGPVAEMTREDWDSIEREARKGLPDGGARS